MTAERWLRGAEVALGVATLGFVASLLWGRLRDAPAGPGAAGRDPPAPLVLTLADSLEVDLPAGEHFDTTFVVDDPRACVLTGEVRGVRGGSRDVEVYVLDPAGSADWHDGVRPSALFASGRAPSASLWVPLPGPGAYTLLVSNQYSILRGKKVLVRDARVTCG